MKAKQIDTVEDASGVPSDKTVLFKQKIIFIACLVLIIGLMAMDFINPSLPYIMKNLSASQASTKSLMITYLLTMALAQLYYGTYSDNHGRRKALFLAFIIATVGCLLSALSNSMQMLYLSRMITAMGMAATPVISRALIVDVCHDHISLKKAFSYFAMFSQISPAIAPFFGGLIQHFATWRISFFVLAAISLAAIFFLWVFMPETHILPQFPKKFLQQIKTYLEISVLQPFLPFSILSSLIMMFTIGYYSLMPFVFHHLGVNAMVNGLMCIPYALGLLSGAAGMSTVLNRFDSEKLFSNCLIIIFLFLLATLLVSFYFENLLIISLLAIGLGFLCGVTAPLSLTLAMQGFETNRGAASALQAFIRYFFCGIALLLGNLVKLEKLYQLIIIFLIVSATMLIFYFTNRQKCCC